jgi:5'-methylthioadenosine phosphorylase
MADPVCPRLSEMAGAAVKAAKGKLTQGATYLAIEGPQFSTRAESRMYREWGADIIGMTAMPEAKLAREAELPYALVGMVTDYDCWRDDSEAVDVAQVVTQMQANSQLARDMVTNFIAKLPSKRSASPFDLALEDAVITAPDQHDPALLAKLDAVAGRLLGHN